MSASKADFSSDEGVLTAGVTPTQTERGGSLTLKKQFLPWHKPRKHWLRKNQWNESIRALATHLGLQQSRRPLDYLCLPGQDLLDIRALSPICEQMGVTLRFLGLNYVDPAEPKAAQLAIEQATSLSEVHGMRNIDNASIVLPERFESIAHEDSVTYDKIINSRDTFDVVNIDLCRSFGEGQPSDVDATLYDALFQLFHKQATSRTEDWLFFLTTRNNTGMVHADVWDKLITLVNRKRRADPGFAEILEKDGIVDASSIVDDEIVKDKLSRDSFVGIFGVGVGLWIVECLLQATPGWRAEMLPSYGYHVYTRADDPNCDMISLAFRCTRIRYSAHDPNGLANRPIGAKEVDIDEHRKQCETAVLREHSAQVDLDLRLNQLPDEHTEALEGSVELLRSARYDVDEYRKFAEKSFQQLDRYLRESGLLGPQAVAAAQ
ncbi:PP_RS20740 family protein [Burkholderia cenocepacia]|uniref:PP_RS20740 family protein n=1 Tax=Burkholderia cenocepacia TaxID=95486 RepID=UPI00358F0837